MDFSIKIIEDNSAQKTLKVETSKEKTEQYFREALESLARSRPLKGFRPGSVPFELGVKTFGEARIIQDVAQKALYDLLPKIIKAEGFRMLGDPHIQFGALTVGTPLEFTLTLGRYPQHISFEYKDVIIKGKPVEVNDEEITRTLEALARSRKAQVIDDAFASSLGRFKDLEDLKQSIREGIRIDKTSLYKEQMRAKLLDKISEIASLEIPEMAITQEVAKRISSYQTMLEGEGNSWQDYLSKVKKSEEDIEKEESEAIRRAFAHAIILEEIAKREGITVSEETITKAFNALLLRYRNVKEAQKEIDIPSTRAEITQRLLQNTVFEKILDNQITS